MPPPKKKVDPESFFLCRIVGNDLVPRHTPGQSRKNMEFILENEEPFESCTKFWIVNRIVDDAERNRIIRLLEDRRQAYDVIPFDLTAYAKADLDTTRIPPGLDKPAALLNLDNRQRLAFQAAIRTSKINAAIGVNATRNMAISLGRTKARWILPWDGNCFVTPAGWRQIRQTVLNRQRLPYFIVPMARTTDNSTLLDPGFQPDAKEEPQIVFRNDAHEKFDERYAYGHLDKIELLLRLNVPGRWHSWPRTAWDLPRSKSSPDKGKFATAGWVARLASGRDSQEVGKTSSTLRAEARTRAILDFIARLDALANSASIESNIPET